MGCDGGTIPRRDELVRLKKKPEQVDKNMERMAKWLHCAISQERLRQPIMACELGRLYNKESLLEYLLDKSTCDSAQHIRGLKDVKELNMTSNPAFEKSGQQKEDLYLENGTTQYICPVTGLQMNGHYKFCFLWECGCVLSEKALKEVKSDVCHKCGAAYDVDDAVIINGSPEEVDDLRSKMEDKRAKAKAEKKAKKAQKRKSEVPCTVTSPTTDDQPSTSKQIKTDSEKLTNGTPGSSKLTNGQPASSKPTNGAAGPSSKPASGQKAASGKLTNGSASSLKSTNGSKDTPFDHTKSAVYKSLFLPKDQKGINKAHWVTYNPYYAMSK
ncbi:replication termination factor 2-like [Patiria miniata]|uniref:Replication termination factor 2 n=1 Tax=Patiria miniata TaxID=46514 RepID=A0A914A1E8_PATMI|nr:replication termination factor 2-like [Patiria miniata]